MKKLYNAGRKLEYRLKKELEKQGYLVIRSAGSHSPFDLVALNPHTNKIRFIQVKQGAKYPMHLVKSFSSDIYKIYFGEPSVSTYLLPSFEIFIRNNRKWLAYTYDGSVVVFK